MKKIEKNFAEERPLILEKSHSFDEWMTLSIKKQNMLTRSYILGLTFLLIAAVIWAGASILTQFIYSNLNFQSPFLITYIANSLFVLYLPLWQMRVWMGWIKDPPLLGCFGGDKKEIVINPISADNDSIHQSTTNESSFFSGGQVQIGMAVDAGSASQKEDGRAMDGRESETAVNATVVYTHRDIARAALAISPLWFISNCLYNYSLLMTSNSSSTIIRFVCRSLTFSHFITAGLFHNIPHPLSLYVSCFLRDFVFMSSNLAASFTLFFSWYVGIEAVTFGKVAGIIFCFSGAIMVGFADREAMSSGGQRTTAGDIVALLSALGYGIYTTMIRIKVPDNDSVPMQLVFGYIGAINLCGLLPLLLILVSSY